MGDSLIEGTMEDAELLHLSMKGDDEAFLMLYQRHGHDLFGFAMRSLGSREAAEDVTHDSFLALLERPSGYNSSRGQLRLYLFGIARNLIRRRLKSEHATDMVRKHAGGQGGLDPHQMIEKMEIVERVRSAIFELPPLQRESLILFHYQGFSLHEICQITGDGLEAVKQRLFRARATLRRNLLGGLPMASAGK